MDDTFGTQLNLKKEIWKERECIGAGEEQA